MKIDQITVQNYGVGNQAQKASKTGFKGYVNNNYYSDDVIGLAKKCIAENSLAEKVTASCKKDFSDAWAESSSGLEVLPALITRGVDLLFNGGSKKSPNTMDDHLMVHRGLVDAFSIGLNEVLELPGALIKHSQNKAKYRDLVNNVKNCVTDLLIEKSNKEIKESELKVKKEATYLKMQEDMRIGFVESVLAEEKGKTAAKVPNIIAIETDDKKDINRLVDYATTETGATLLKMSKADEENMFNIFDIMLENIEKNNLPKGKRTIIKIDGFETMANENVREENMGMLKRVACELANKYKTTIIFGTDDLSKIAPAIKQGHRTGLQILKKAHV